MLVTLQVDTRKADNVRVQSPILQTEPSAPFKSHGVETKERKRRKTIGPD